MGKNLFNSIQLKKPKRNYFDLSHDVKLSCNMGQLVPIMVMDCVPGDKITINCESLIRFAPLIAPIMHRVDISMHYFFVPNRILWDNWEDFITNANSGIVAPYVVNSYSTDANYAKLYDYLGYPTSATAGVNVNALPFAAYQAIYNEYYRDENLVTAIDYKLTDGNNGATTARKDALLKLRNRSWEHDYFTSSLPWAQKGAQVTVPLGSITGNAPIYLDQTVYGQTTTFTGTNGNAQVTKKLSDSTTTDLYAETSGLQLGNTTINELRRSFRLQEWLEKNARGGTRYIESILSHFGVKSSDARLQRPEYITGVKSPVTISEVLNTTGSFTSGSPTSITSPVQGNMAGHGISVGSGHNGSYYCEEHGWIMGIMSVMPKTAYQQGLPKMFTRFDNLDYFWPEFANIGEQEVKNKELYLDSNATYNESTFGYVPRYAEYKFIPSRVAGSFKTSLDYWHLGRKFATAPALNQAFIECTPEATSRIFAVTDPTVDHVYCHIYNQIKAIRPMPKFGTPSGI